MASGIPTGPRLFERPIAMLARGLREKWQDDFACGAPRRYVEKLHLTWPAGKKLAKMPRDLDISRGAVTYRAHYLLGDNGLDIERETIFTPARAACTVADLKAASDAIYAATGDLDGRIAFAKPGQIWLISRRATAPKARD